MELLARLLLRRDIAWAVTVLVAIIAVGFSLLARGVEQDDDILAFLPDGNSEVALFQDINQRFGGLDVALVGIEAGEGLFSAEFLARLQRATDTLGDLESVSYALSIANLEDLSADPELGGIKVAPLVDALPTSEQEEQALRRKVMSRDSAVGNLVSRSGDAVLIYCFLVPGSDPRASAEQIRVVVDHEFDGYRRYWGGAPFISSYIYETTDRDMAKLTPWAVLAIILVLMLCFRDLVGTALALLTTGIGIVVAHGSMALAGQSFNIVLSSMPIILFAVGSAYSIHILSHYYAHHEQLGRDGALRSALVELGPVVAAAGLTTVAGLLSFVMMDIEPMRTFGLFTALGIFTTLVLSLTFVPAVIRITGLKRRATTSSAPAAAMTWLSGHVVRHKKTVGLVVAVLALLAAAFAGRVEARMDQSSFFAEGSPPHQSEAFLGQHFGGSQFIQLHIKGDMKSPQVLREVRRVADRVRTFPGVTDVLHIGQAVAIANEAMEGARRIPDTPQKIGLLYGLIQGNKAVSQLVSDDRNEALVQVKLHLEEAEEIGDILRKIESMIYNETVWLGSGGPLTQYRIVTRAEAPELVSARLTEVVTWRVRALLQPFDLGIDEATWEALPHLLQEERTLPEAQTIQKALDSFIRSEECIAELPEDDPNLPTRLAAALAALGPEPGDDSLLSAIRATVRSAGVQRPTGSTEPTDQQLTLIDDLEFSVGAALRETWSQETARTAARKLVTSSSLALPPGDAGARLLEQLAAAILDLDSPSAMVDATVDTVTGTLHWQVTGLPVLHRGLSRSVTQNQTRSLAFALILVLGLMSLFFRSPLAGMLATAPTVLTLLLIFGVMGALGVHLDIGTSMLSSIIIGAGVDYGVHLLAGWRGSGDNMLQHAARNAAGTTSEAIWTNAAMVAVGFFVLTLGESRPLHNVGSLTATAMLCAAAATFVVIPMLARRGRYTGA
jgi:predicted RND superfamily exporter protein